MPFEIGHWLAVALLIATLTLGAMVGWIPLAPSSGLSDLTAAVISFPEYYEVSASQLESATSMLQTIAIGPFLIVGIGYKDVMTTRFSLRPVELFFFLGFLAAEVLEVYYGYFLRLRLVENLSIGQFQSAALLRILSYQAYAVIFASMSAALVFFFRLLSTDKKASSKSKET